MYFFLVFYDVTYVINFLNFVPIIIFAEYYVFNANISFTFQAIKNLHAHFTYLCFGPLCKFLGDF